MEYFDIRDAEGNVTGITKERSLVHRDGDIHGTSHVWLVRENADDGFDLLLQKRSRGKDSFPGCYDISSAGHLPAGQDYLESAIRELKEELGIEANADELHYIGRHDALLETEFYGRPWRNYELSAVYVLKRDIKPGEFMLQTSEVESVRWISYPECMEQILKKTLKHCIYQDEMEMLGRYLSGLKEEA